MVICVQQGANDLYMDDNDWVKKCMDFEVEGVRPGAKPKKTRSEVIEKVY